MSLFVRLCFQLFVRKESLILELLRSFSDSLCSLQSSWNVLSNFSLLVVCDFYSLN